MDKSNNNVQGVIHFPCHSKEKVLVVKGARGGCSVKCPYCDSFALFDFNNMKSKPIKAARGAIHNIKNQNSYID